MYYHIIARLLGSTLNEKTHMTINKEGENHCKARLQIFSLQPCVRGKILKMKMIQFPMSSNLIKTGRDVFNHLLFLRLSHLFSYTIQFYVDLNYVAFTNCYYKCSII